MSFSATRFVGLGIAVSALAVSLVGCGSNDDSGSGSGGAKKIALLLPESKTTRYEALDRPLFTEALKAACGNCELIYSNADQDASKQQQQAEAALTQGANVLVLDPVDGKAAAAVVSSAKGQNVPVVAYDRFIENANYYVSFENEAVGKLQAQTLVDDLKAAGKTSGNIAMINGSPTDPNAADFKKGAHSVLDSSGFLSTSCTANAATRRMSAATVTTITGVSRARPSARSAASRSRPFMSGSSRSSVTASKLRSRQSRIASAPFAAISTP